MVMVSLDSSLRMIFGSAAVNFGVRSLGLGSSLLLITVMKPLSSPLGAASLAQEVGAGKVVGGAGIGVSWG